MGGEKKVLNRGAVIALAANAVAIIGLVVVAIDVASNVKSMGVRLNTAESNLSTVGTLRAELKRNDASIPQIAKLPESVAALSHSVELLKTQLEQLSVPAGTIIPWDPVVRRTDGTGTGERRQIPSGWRICNGSDGTPNLSGLFLEGVVDVANAGNQGGQSDITPAGQHSHGGSTGRVDDQGTPKENGNDGRHPHGHAHSISSDGNHNHGGENRPPFYTVLFIMKLD